jgi:2,3-bisphosphoglycerate-independent phosphoglycerate mutase
MSRQKTVLIICDGLGFRQETEHNAVAQARTPNLDSYSATYPHALLAASGEAIGLPAGQMGTSEANHLVIGSGRVIYQNLVKINRAVSDNSLIEAEAIREALDHVKEHGGILHIKGIISDGGVHGHIDHLKALVESAKNHGVRKVHLHLFTDGRDTAPQSAMGYIEDLEKFLAEVGVGRIVSLGGRYWGMDRDNNHERVEKHFAAMVRGEGPRFGSAVEAIEHNYNQGIFDEFIEPATIAAEEEELGCVGANDAVIFANFRSDRARQIAKRFSDEKIPNLKYVGMTNYGDDLDIRVAYDKEVIANTLSEVIANNGLKQLKVTETEKFTHLTFFFNAQKYEPEPGEERILIESDKEVATHDQKPEMQADHITEEVCKAIRGDRFDFIAVNLTNCDMVGHSGNFPAIVRAVETVDRALGQIVEAAQRLGYCVIITADHGNAEQTHDERVGQPLTSHTLNPVPLILISDKYRTINRGQGDLSDIAPTVLKILDLPIPGEMTGQAFV